MNISFLFWFVSFFGILILGKKDELQEVFLWASYTRASAKSMEMMHRQQDFPLSIYIMMSLKIELLIMHHNLFPKDSAFDQSYEYI